MKVWFVIYFVEIWESEDNLYDKKPTGKCLKSQMYAVMFALGGIVTVAV